MNPKLTFSHFPQYTLLTLNEAKIVGIALGAIVAIVGLISAIVCVINYGIDNILTAIFFAVFITGLLIVGIVESQ